MDGSEYSFSQVRMAERSKALRSGRSLVLQAWVRIPLLTNKFFDRFLKVELAVQNNVWCFVRMHFFYNFQCFVLYWYHICTTL